MNPDGRPERIQHSVMLGLVSVITSKRDAQTMLEDRLRQLNVCQAAPRAPLGFEVFFREWQRTTLPLLRPATSRFYNEKATTHLVPYFGARRLTDIRTLEIQVFLNQKANRYSRSTLQHIKATLSRLFSDAVAWGYVRDNPVRNVKLPHARLAPPQPFLTPEQVRMLVFALREPYRTLVLTAVLTGLRPSELSDPAEERPHQQGGLDTFPEIDDECGDEGKAVAAARTRAREQLIEDPRLLLDQGRVSVHQGRAEVAERDLDRLGPVRIMGADLSFERFETLKVGVEDDAIGLGDTARRAE